MGYALAWERRRELLAVLVVVLVPVELAHLALRLAAGPDDAAVVNGELFAPVPSGFLGFVDAVFSVAVWLLAITAAVITLGWPPLGTKERFLKAAKALPFLGFWGVAAVAALFVTFAVAGGLGLFGLVPLVVLAFVLARLALVVPSRALDGDRSWTLADGRFLSTALRIIVGVVVVPGLAAWLFDRVSGLLLQVLPSVGTGAAVRALDVAVLVALTGLQAATLTAVYLDLSAQEIPEPVRRPRPGVVNAALAALALPAAAAVAIAPSHGPLVTLRQDALDGWASEILHVIEREPIAGYEGVGSALMPGSSMSVPVRLAVLPDGIVLITERTNIITVRP